MTNEEKAKAYDEAVKIARCWLNAPQTIQECNYTIEDAIQNIFPELCGSEDERIRKELVEKISNLACGCFISQEQKQKFIAYLERQKEEEEKCPTYLDLASNEFEACMLRYLQSAANRKDDGMIMIDTKGYAAQLMEIAKKMQKPTATINGEPIPTENQSVDIPLTKWTNEDERIANALILELKTNPSVATTNGYKRGDYIDWLNDLLAKPRRECSKNDKKVLESAIYWLRKRLKDENAHDIVTVESPMSVKETVERLESLQPQERLVWDDETMRKMMKEAGLNKKQVDWITENVYPPKEVSAVPLNHSIKDLDEDDSDKIEDIINYLYLLDRYVADDCSMNDIDTERIRKKIREVLVPWLNRFEVMNRSWED